MQRILKIKLADVVDSKYGSASNLETKIHLPLGKNYKIPAILTDTANFQKLVTDSALKFRVSLNEDRETSMRHITQETRWVIYQNPSMDWGNDPSCTLLMDYNLGLFEMDDFTDGFLKVVDGKRNYKLYTTFMEAFFDPNVDFDSFIPEMVSGPPDSPMSRFGTALKLFHKAIIALISGKDASLVNFFKDELDNTHEANYFMLSEKDKDGLEFSPVNFDRTIWQFITGMRPNCVASALSYPNVRVPEKVQKSPLFQIMLDSFGNGTAYMNAIGGLKKDIREDTAADTPILTDVVKRGWTLQEAFDHAAQTFQADIMDLHLALGILRETYEDTEGVDEFLDVVENVFVGYIMSYADEAACNRYDGLSIEITQVPAPAEVPLLKTIPGKSLTTITPA